MQIQLKNINDVAVMEVEGEIDLYNSPKLRQRISSEISIGTTKLLVDFEKVKYIDSSGLATLIEGLQKMNRQKGQFKLCSLSQSILDIFEVARLDDVFDIYPNQKEALDDFKEE